MDKLNSMTDKNLALKDKRYYEPVWKKAINRILVFFLTLVSWLPFPVIYFLSDLFYLLVKYGIKYRRKVIVENLTCAFPEKTAKEIQKLTNRYYRHFCDLSLEVIKLHSMSEKNIDKRVVFKGTDLMERIFDENKNMIVLAMHHNNWEWGSLVHRKTRYTGIMVYDPIRGNQAFEQFLVRSRTRFGGVCVPVHKAARTTAELNKLGKPTALWLGADQAPPANSKFWTIFLNREAPFFSGPEKIAIKTNQPVFFHHVRKIKLGHYEISYVPLFMTPQHCKPNEIMLEYVRKMEEAISEQPEFYLWSHRRWKHKRPEGIPLTL